MNNIKNGDYIWESWGRGYYFNGNNYPGVGSILKETMSAANKRSLDNWRKRVGKDEAEKISSEARTNGTNWHNFLDLFVQKKYSDAQNLLAGDANLRAIYVSSRNFLLQFAKVTDQVLTEKPIYSETYGYAGTFDCVAIANNEKILLDWKTSRKQKKEQYVSDYYLQVAAYCNAVEEMEQEKLDRATIVVFYNFKQTDIFKLSREDLDFQFQLFKNRLDKFYEIYPSQLS
jgi:hypothetical protein